MSRASSVMKAPRSVCLVVEKGEVSSVEEGQNVGRARVWLAKRRYRGYDVSYGEAREGDHQTSASTPRNASWYGLPGESWLHVR